MRVYRFHTRDIPTGGISHLWRPLLTGVARRVPMARLYEYYLPHKTSLVWHSGNPLWWRCDTYSIELTRVDSQAQLDQLPYSRCCSLLYPTPATGSISSCLQLTLTEVTHLMDPWSGSLVTLGHTAQNSNTRDVISNGISGSRTNHWLKIHNAHLQVSKTQISMCGSWAYDGNHLKIVSHHELHSYILQ